MKEYWNVPKIIGMIAAVLDSRLKSLKFVNDNAIKSETIRKLHELYSAEKLADELNPLNSTSNPQQNTMTSTVSSSNSIIAALLDDDDHNNNNNNNSDINEVDAYLSIQVSKQRCDPLNWWKDHLKRFPLLSQIACKYLSIPATSVLSERLFQMLDCILQPATTV